MAKRTKKASLLSVSRRALIQRINRRLAPESRVLRTNRSEKWRGEIGDYYILDLQYNVMVDTRIDLEGYGREIGALRAWEALADE